MPKVRASAIESNSRPKSLSVPVMRAILPSRKSVIAATMRSAPAISKRPRSARMVAQKPRKMLPIVNRLGSR
jgi:hypothetical protein